MLAQILLTIFNKFRKAAPFRQSQFSCPVLGSIQSPSVVNLLEFPACVNRRRLYFPYLCQFTWLEFPASIEPSQITIIYQCPDCINLQRLVCPYLWHFTGILQLPKSVDLPHGMMPRFGQCPYFVNCQMFYKKNKITWNSQRSYRDFVASLIFLVFSLFNFSEENVSLKTFEK